MYRVALSIAGSDPSGGAGIQADLKTFHQFGVYGEAVLTLITVQNTECVRRVERLPSELVAAQLSAVVEDIPPHAAKTGALGSADVVEAVAEASAQFDFPLVVDPVLISKHGRPLAAEDAIPTMRERLIPRAALVTPNLSEAAVLTGIPVNGFEDMHQAALRIRDMGARAVLIKGGHLLGDPVDLLFDGADWHEFSAARIETPHTHGTGCTLSAAITACLARGEPLVTAVAKAKCYITEAIRLHPSLGRGSGPVYHHAPAPEKSI